MTTFNPYIHFWKILLIYLYYFKQQRIRKIIINRNLQKYLQNIYIKRIILSCIWIDTNTYIYIKFSFNVNLFMIFRIAKREYVRVWVWLGAFACICINNLTSSFWRSRIINIVASIGYFFYYYFQYCFWNPKQFWKLMV